MPYNVKALKAWVKNNGVTVLDIKKRGTAVTPEELRKQLLPAKPIKGKDAKTATLVLTRIGEERVAVVVEPVTADVSQELAAGELRSFTHLLGARTHARV